MTGHQTVPRPEHPKPQFQRETWLNLNGPWSYRFGVEVGTEFPHTIQVPFCPESKLSGVGHTDFIDAMWYQRNLEIPSAWNGKRILLHFGGVDYESETFIDGASVGLHVGGSVSFCHDVTANVTAGGTHKLVVRVADDVRSGLQPGGKQSQQRDSEGCFYTRTTGIWQTVWLEAVDMHGLKAVHIVPDFDGGRFVITPRFHAVKQGLTFRVTASAESAVVTTETVAAVDGVAVVLSIPNARSWSPESPFLYDLKLEISDSSGLILDEVHSYAGLRKIHIEGSRIFLNNQPLYQRLVLDQGFYPDGIWTAQSDEALKRDIELSMKAGFNGARLHQKVFEERFHYWADKLGYLTWGESASWGCDPNNEIAARNFLSEWREIIERDRNHPSIIAWTPWNETWSRTNQKTFDRVHRDSYDMAHSLDPTRPVNGSSGGALVVTDLYTAHTYDQSPESLRRHLAMSRSDVTNQRRVRHPAYMENSETVGRLSESASFHAVGVPWHSHPQLNVPYKGQPYLVDEWGGIKWIPAERRPHANNSWGYGEGPKTIAEFYERLSGQANAILSHDHIVGYCYTQLTDVEQEQNGIYNYDRTEKFDMTRIAEVFGRKPLWICGV